MNEELETWDCKRQESIETPKEMIEFFNEIDKVCKKYNLSISHEDGHGAFIIEKYCKGNIDWLKYAHKDY